MEMIEKLETTLGGWFKQAPHLPANVQKWIAQNVWWLTLIGVVLSAFAILAVLPILFGASLFLASIGGAYGYYSGLGLVNTWVVSFGFGIAILVIEAFAIKPLKSLSKKGWNLIFLSMILSVASSVVSAVLLMSVGSLFSAALGAVIGGYFLFEVRSYFVTSRKVEAKKA